MRDMYENLGDRWTGEGFPKTSTRQLADDMNVRILEKELEGVSLDASVRQVYELIKGEEGEEVDRLTLIETINDKLNRVSDDGETRNVEEIRGNFVSHQTVYRHVRNCLDLERKEGSGSRGTPGELQDDLEQILNKSADKIYERLDREFEDVAGVDIEVVRVEDNDGSKVPLERFLSQKLD